VKIDRTSKDGTVLVRVDGDIDYDSSREFADELMCCVAAKEPRVEIDMSGCRFINSAGLGAVAAAVAVARARGGDVVLAGVSPSIRKLFAITGLDNIIEFK